MPSKKKQAKRNDFLNMCVRRAVTCGYDRKTVALDLVACNDKTPLDFEKLYKFDEFNFAHDIEGINRHLSHETYELGSCFLPRCAK